MKRRVTATVTALTLSLSMAVAGNLAFAGDDDQGLHRGNFADRVAGTYVIAAYLGDSVPGESVPIQALATLTADGGVVATDTDDFGYEILQDFHSPKHGSWQRTGKREVTITIYELGFTDLGLGDPAPAVVFKLTFVAEFADNNFNGGAGVVAYSVRFLPILDPGADPLDLDSGLPAGPPGSGTVAFKRVAM
jgi:hypothetical protein